MSSNTIKINDSDALTFYVGDNMIGDLLRLIDKNSIEIKDPGDRCTCGENDGCMNCTPSKGETVIELKDVLPKHELLDIWFNELTFPAKKRFFIRVVREYGSSDEVLREFCFYTTDHKYTIVAIDRPGQDGYLGCQVLTRKARAGEDWNRGNDLPDGPFTKDTWDKILKSIVKYELIRLSEYQKPTNVPEDVDI